MDLDVWKKQRRYTVINVCVGAFLFGLSLQIYQTTEYYYFKDTMKLKKDADFYYGLSWGALCGSGAIFSLFGSYYYDRTNNIVCIFIFSSLMNVLGNILYLLYYSPFIVLFGQILIGMAATRMAAGVGEISLIYEADRLTQNVSLLAIFSCLGSVLGPCSTYVFNLVNTRIGDWKLNVNNVVGVVMASLNLLYLLLNIFTLRNVSKSFNLKKESLERLLEHVNNDDECGDGEEESDVNSSDEKDDVKMTEKDGADADEIEEMTFSEKYKFTLKALFRNRQVLFIYWLSFFTSFSRGTLIMFFPIKASYYLNYTQIDIATVGVVGIFAGAFPTAIVFSYLSKKINDFYLLLLPEITLLLAVFAMILIPYVQSFNARVGLLYPCAVLTVSSATGFHIISRSMLAKLVPHNIQAFTDATRNILFELSFMIAGLSIKLSSLYMLEFGITVGIICIICIVWLVLHSERYKKIELVSM